MSTWDVRTSEGAVVTSLAGLASALVTSREGAARALLADADLLAAAPSGLLAEVKATIKPGDGKAPPVMSGAFVSWGDTVGRVDLVVSNGTVPGFEDAVGTKDSPAARVVVWSDGKPTDAKVAVPTILLTRIKALDTAETTDAATFLVDAVSSNTRRVQEFGLPGYALVTGTAVKAVYDRGLSSWPGFDATDLSREQWASGRVEHFVAVAAGDVEAKDAAGHDLDLLNSAHPMVAGDRVHVSMADVDQQVKSLLEGIDA